MIINCRFTNFYSFAEENAVSFVVGQKPKPSYYDMMAPDESRLNKVIAVIGANGAGKTHLVRLFAFLGWFIADSAHTTEPDDSIVFQPHLLYRDAPTQISIAFFLDGEHYKYDLTLTQHAVLHESLHLKTRRFSYVFVREKTDAGYDYKQKPVFGFSSKQAKNVRQNVSLLSAANMYDVPEARRFVQYFEKIAHNVNMFGRQRYDGGDILHCAEFFHQQTALQQRLNELLCQWDLGLSGIEYKEQTALDHNGKEADLIVPFGQHQSEKGTFSLPLFMESNGTQSAFVLLRRLLPVLAQGGIAVIDELDNDLHPHMLPALLDLFKHTATNPHQAQLIFTCHSVELLNELAKHQVYLVEKNDLISETWRLDEVQGLRADDNLYAKYLSGALGAVPNL